MARSRSTRATAKANPPAATAGKRTPKPNRSKKTPARFVNSPKKATAGKKAATIDDSNSEPDDDESGAHHLANQRATQKLAEQRERTEEQAKINGMLKREVEKAKKLELARREEQKEKRQCLKRQREERREERREDRSPTPGFSGDSSVEAENDSTDSEQDHGQERRRRRDSSNHGNRKINADLKKATRVDRNREKKNQRERAAHAETEFAKMVDAQVKDLSTAEKRAITDNMVRQGKNLLELVAEVESGHDQMKKTIAALKKCNTDTSVKKMITSMATIMEEVQQGEAHALTKAAFQAFSRTFRLAWDVATQKAATTLTSPGKPEAACFACGPMPTGKQGHHKRCTPRACPNCDEHQAGRIRNGILGIYDPPATRRREANRDSGQWYGNNDHGGRESMGGRGNRDDGQRRDRAQSREKSPDGRRFTLREIALLKKEFMGSTDDSRSASSTRNRK